MMTIKEDISVFRNVAHWLLAPPTLLVYSIIAFYAIIKFVFVGKKMARHDMAAKDGLASVTALSAPGGSGGASSSNSNSTSAPGAYEDEPTVLKAQRSRSSSDHHLAGAPHPAFKNVGGGAQQSQGQRQDVKDFAPANTKTFVANGDGALLCKLPDKFSFGAYSVETSQVKYRSVARNQV